MSTKAQPHRKRTEILCIQTGRRCFRSVSRPLDLLKNVSDQQLHVLQINAVFNRVTEESEWSSQFVTVAGSDGLAPGATSQMLTINAPLGYTGTEARQQMLANSQFVDAKVQLFVKYGSVQWTRLGDYPIARNLIAK